MTTPFKHYTEQQLATIAHEDHIVWLDFPSSYRFLFERWTEGWSHGRQPQIEYLVAYSVVGPDAPATKPAGTVSRRAWTSPPAWRTYLIGIAPPGSVDPVSIIAGQPSRLAEGAAE
jgi:hypothetical protein